MNPKNLTARNLLPHRGPMLLVDDIIAVDNQKAVTRSVAADTWPLFDGDCIHPIILIELVAQTAGIHNGWVREKTEGPDIDKRGWVVGVKHARLPCRGFALETEFITRSENRFEFEGFREILGTVEVEGAVIAEITIQLLRSGANVEKSE